MKNNKTNIPATKAAPAKNAEKTAKNARIFVEGKTKTYKSSREEVKDAKAILRAVRIKRMLNAGITQEQIAEMESNEKVRTILCLSYGSYTVENGTRTKKVNVRDEHHKVTGKKEIQVPNILRGTEAIEFTVKSNNMEVLAKGATYIYVKTDTDRVDEATKLMSPMGRLYVYTWHKKEESAVKKKKPTNNTKETKSTAKASRKKANINGAEMRPYYAALRKGGVNERIKKHNPTLANKIEAWLKERRKSDAEKAECVDKHKRDHRQMSSVEMKANRRARKAAKYLARKERKMQNEEKRAEINAEKTVLQKSRKTKAVQKELKMAA